MIERRITAIDRKIRLDARRSVLGELLDRLNMDLTDAGCPEEKRTEIGICAEEIFVNIASYAYRDMTGDVTIEERIYQDSPQEKVLMLVFKDSGIPFNPLAREKPDVTLPESERRIGGLGIYMVKNMTDRAWYEYQDDINCLYLEYRWQQM